MNTDTSPPVTAHRQDHHRPARPRTLAIAQLQQFPWLPRFFDALQLASERQTPHKASQMARLADRLERIRPRRAATEGPERL